MAGSFFTRALHPDKITTQHVTFLTVVCVMLALATILVLLRFVQRSRMDRNQKTFWWDDWAILAALLCAYGHLGGAIADKYAGYHINQYTVDGLNDVSKDTLAEEVFYNASVALSKASVLLFYNRIFSVDKTLSYTLRILGFFVFGYCMAAVFGLIFADHPFQAQWNVTEPHTSIHDMAFWISMAAINITLDFTILSIPQVKIRKLQMSRKRRFLLQGVFLLGAFVIIASIVRIVYLCTINLADITYTIDPPAIWTAVEMDMSIVCASLPTVYGLFSFPKLHVNGTQPTNKFSALSSLRRLLGSRDNTSYADIENPTSSGNCVNIVGKSDGVPERSDQESYDMASLRPITVQKTFVVE